LHAHSHHSDGSAPLRDLVAAATAQGLDFVSVTEHNTVSHLPLLPALTTDELLLIPGVEISTYRGHANVWPVRWPDDTFVEFRCWTDEQMIQVREAMRKRGALFSINHPKDEGPPWRFGGLFAPDCIEVWGAPWFISNYQSLAVWDARLRQGDRITAVGGSDKHQGPFGGELGWYELGTPCTWVRASELSVEGIIHGIRTGRVFISEGPDGPWIELVAEGIDADGKGVQGQIGDDLYLSPGTELRLCCRVRGGAGNLMRLVSARDVLQVEIADDDFSYEGRVVVDGDTYWRAEVIEPPEAPLEEEPAALMAKVLTNPIYVRAVAGRV
jgi:predicted metal-dependent phosphoesterase TrpH